MSDFRRDRITICLICFAVLCGALALAPVSLGQSLFGSSPKLTVTVTAQGSAAKDKPLPVGAVATLKAVIRNETKDAIGPVALSPKFEGMKAESQPNWKIEGDRISGEIAKIEPGAVAERQLKLRIVKAPFPAAKTSVAIEASGGEKLTASGSVNFMIADCAGTYREKLGVLRTGILQSVRDTADAMRKPDASLPGSRMFPLTGSRKGEIAAAERLAAPLAIRGGADMQMSTEWMRFLILRWVSELTNYSTQPVNPGMCANNYYQIAGYREGLQPITKRLDAFKESGSNTLTAARMAAKDVVSNDIRELVLRFAKTNEIEGVEENASVFAMLSAIRTALGRGKKLEAEQMETLSLAETAAWLQETDKRGQALNGVIEKVLGTIAEAHKESCVCAY